MAKKQIVTITDDIDGRSPAEPVTFAFAGRSYEIDLGEKNRAKLEKALAPFIDAARKAGAPARTTPGRASSREDSGAVRAWATENGLEVSARGRISRSVRDAYAAAH
jgi:hypothetical protein